MMAKRGSSESEREESMKTTRYGSSA